MSYFELQIKEHLFSSVDPSTINGNMCYYCDGQNCSNTVNCSGSEDRCITVTGENQDSSAYFVSL